MGLFNFGKKKKNLPKSYKDAKKIVDSVNDEVLYSCWDIYSHIKKNHPEQYGEYDEKIFKKLTLSWEALRKLIENDGNFKSLKKDKLYLYALRDGHLVYHDLIHVLIDHHDDKEEAEYLFKQHPRLHDAIPKEYDNVDQVIEVLLEYAKDYQWRLEHFAMQYNGEIEKALGGKFDDDEIYVSRD